VAGRGSWSVVERCSAARRHRVDGFSKKRQTMANLKGLKVAILITDGFEQVELVEPRAA
jgi:hypothetical protein